MSKCLLGLGGTGPALILGFLGGMWGLLGSGTQGGLFGANYFTVLSCLGGLAGLWILLGGWKIISIVMQTLPRYVKENNTTNGERHSSNFAMSIKIFF